MLATVQSTVYSRDLYTRQKKKVLLARFEKAVLGSFGKFEDFLPNCLTAYKWQNFNGSIFFQRMYCDKNQ